MGGKIAMSNEVILNIVSMYSRLSETDEKKEINRRFFMDAKEYLEMVDDS